MKLNKNAFKCNLIATTWPVDQNLKKNDLLEVNE